jgi:BASS family bile acid:Na+ symporter
MAEFENTMFNLFVLIFVLSSMLGLGLSITLKEIAGTLKNIPLILKSLLANFVLVPLVGFVMIKALDLDQGVAAGLVLMSLSAGAPMLAKYSQVAKANLAFAATLMVLLQVGTIIVVPIVFPLIVPGADVSAWGIIKSLFTTLLLPLVVGVFIRARYESWVETIQKYAAPLSSLGLVGTLIFAVLLYADDLLSMWGTGAFILVILLILLALGIGYLLGGPERDNREVLGMGTAQRNLSAALLISTQNFSDQPTALLTVLIGALLMMVVLVPLSGEFGHHNAKGQAQPETP